MSHSYLSGSQLCTTSNQSVSQSSHESISQFWKAVLDPGEAQADVHYRGRAVGPGVTASGGGRGDVDLQRLGICILLHPCILTWLHEVLFFKRAHAMMRGLHSGV